MTRPLLVIGALALQATVVLAQQAPAFRTLASFQGDSVEELSLAPNGRFVVLSTRTSLWMYEVASRQSWKLADGGEGELSWSPRGDKIAYMRARDGGSPYDLWVLPVNANTGRASGPAQRVTIGRGVDRAVPVRISADGRWMAFAGIDSADARTLSIVPTTGGPERILARIPGVFMLEWSADGETIYFNGWRPPNALHVYKIRVEGGAPEEIRSRNEFLAGMTADRRHLILLPRSSGRPVVSRGDLGTVIDTAGREVGRFPLPVGPVIFLGVLGDSALVWYTASDPTAIEIRPMAGGRARRVPLIGESDDSPVWSPDGNRIAFQVREGSRTSLAVMNADGTDPRVYRERELSPRLEGRNWSPDSRFVAFREAGLSRISLLDVAAGTIRTVFEDDSAGMWRWRADGQAIIWRSRRHPGAGIYEMTRDGHARRLLDWPVPKPNPAWQFVGDSTLFVPLDTVVLLRPFGRGQGRRLGSLPPGSELSWTAVSNDRRWVGGLLSDPGLSGRPPHQVALFSLETGTRTVLDVPFNIYTLNSPPAFVPDNSSMLVFGWRDGEYVTLYRVPVDGDPPRAVANVGPFREGGGFVASVSPDGRSVAYSVPSGGRTQSLVLIDLRGAVPRATSPTSRR